MDGKRIISFICFVLILAVAFIPTASALEVSFATADYSRPGSYFNVDFTAADLVEYLGYEVSEGEREYLNAYGGISFKYEKVTNQQINIVTSDTSTKVIARPYTYTGVAGEATWVPVSVTLDSHSGTLILEDDVYVADFDGAEVDENSTVNVEYELDIGEAFTVSADKVNLVLNLAYNNAPSIKEEFERAGEEYDSAKLAYDTFCREHADEIEKFYSDMILYEKYLDDKVIYDEKYSEYTDYLKRYAEYEAQVVLYETYLEDLEEYYAIKENNDSYEENYEKYLDEKAEYDKYLSDLALIREQIAILDKGLMTKVTTLKRQLYSSLYSSLVDDVISANKEIYITMLGVDEAVIDGCADASKDIRAILTPKRGVAYKELKDEEDKYDFYVNNRDELRDAIIKLTVSLHELYSNDRLREMMHNAPAIIGKPDYTEKLSIFISQLILFSNALSDEPVLSFDGSAVLNADTKLRYWKADGTEVKGSRVIDILESNEFVKDNGKAAPISGGYPTAVSEPVAPELLPEINMPKEVHQPIEPDAVPDPGDAPDIVDEPSLPEDMPKEPTRPEIIDNSAYAALISALDDGYIEERGEVVDPVEYIPVITLTKKVISADMVDVTFIGTDGSVINEVSVERGSSANFIGDLPTKEEDISAKYVFTSWVTENGEKYALSSVNENITLYPTFEPVFKEYEINATSGYLDVSVTGEDLSYIPMLHFIDIAKKNRCGLMVSGDNAMLKISYNGLVNIDSYGIEHLVVSAFGSEKTGYTCEILAYTEQGTVADPISVISVYLPVTDGDYARNSILTYTNSQGDTHDAYKSYSGNVVEFRATTGTPYSLNLVPTKYTIDSGSSSLKGMIHAPLHAVPGETVVLDVDLPLGMTVQIAYYLLTDSSKHVIEGNSFVMPEGNVKLVASFSNIFYTVTFVNEGKEISSKRYVYGDTVRIPNDPIKLSDSEYSYEFTGWSPQVENVTGDAIYVAQYEKIPIPKEEEKFPWFTVIYYTFISLASVGIILIVIAILNKTGVISIRKIFSLSGRKLSREGSEARDTAETDSETDTAENNVDDKD